MWDDLYTSVREIEHRLDQLRGVFDLDSILSQIADLEQATHQASFWDDPQEAGRVMQLLSSLKAKIAPWEELKHQVEEIEVLLEMGQDENDPSVGLEIKEELNKVIPRLDNLELITKFSGEHDRHNAYLSIHPGAGGTEACDWAQMLLRMYLRWAERKGYKTEILDLLPGEEAGIKSVIVKVDGEYSYGHLRAEIGVHRLVRISPFDAGARRHTSFASVAVIPEVDESINIDIRPEDLRIDTYRSSGAGGQHVNVTDSAVRITHLPTGIVVCCQSDRSQHKNKASAMKVLRARLYEHEERKKAEEVAKLSGEKLEIAWGSQIRSYVFHPYTMVKDHRTEVERGDGARVMDGDIDGFIESYLKQGKKKET
ncbi:MAG: peptide chain release factor 2 [bacterium]